MKSLSDPFDLGVYSLADAKREEAAGAAAFHGGKSWDAHSHEPGTVLAYAFEEGWDAAYRSANPENNA
ncbi:hypothetical protein ABCV69_004574 [Pseudomonas aeruginosa]|uniref:hypothetical protein n=1 Tax=Pseudomonas aeruginosa TaxID=287 RepID=UPI001BAF5D42|nr:MULTISPECIES: hypothetical protein [Pseudomonadaceae]EKY4114509.1 hypothetical protein [Pseudomonas aeruginosa]ELJ2277912.1 hypothetical protein [Pseudomonas aeruginosa]HBP0221279.1 hypothetical protein [Pseudomonas aeruginosa]HBP0254447.1 hypothetical protein [Pseudomonas aeruginosa]HBP0468431.1 hypothetical protein [Pseudomonas aeruginosa]